MARSVLVLAAFLCSLSVASAFAPTFLAPAAGVSSKAIVSLRMAQAAPPAKLPMNKAKENTLSANKQQWGISEPLKVAAAPAAAAAPKKSSGTQAPPPAKLPVNLAKANAVKANKEQWGIEGPLALGSQGKVSSAAAPSQSKMGAGVSFRKVSRDEIRALAKLVDGKSETEARMILESCGYTGSLLESVRAELANNSGPVSEYEKLYVEAESLVVKSTNTLQRADKLKAESKATLSKISKELEPKIAGLEEKVRAAEANVQQWGWLPFGTATTELEDAKKELDNTQKEISNLKAAASDAEKQSQTLVATSKSELSQASSKRMEALNLRAKTEGAQREATLAKLAARVEQWESMLTQGSKKEVQVALNSPEIKEIFLELGFVPSAKYGATALPGRVAAIMDELQAMTKSVQMSGGSVSSGEDDGSADLLRGAAFLFVPALAIGAALFLTGAVLDIQDGKINFNLNNKPVPAERPAIKIQPGKALSEKFQNVDPATKPIVVYE